MAINAETMQQVIDKALADPGFLTRLSQDPEGVAAQSGLDLTPADAEALRQTVGQNDQEIVEKLRERISMSGLPTGRTRS